LIGERIDANAGGNYGHSGIFDTLMDVAEACTHITLSSRVVSFKRAARETGISSLSVPEPASVKLPAAGACLV
jgi:hypothetical protein